VPAGTNIFANLGGFPTAPQQPVAQPEFQGGLTMPAGLGIQMQQAPAAQ
jgi:hypothetical protein